MDELKRKAHAVWEGSLARGQGRISSESGVLEEEAYSFATRFENEPGTNPDELLAAAHAACFSMALAGDLVAAGYRPERVRTEATCTVTKVTDGFRITHMLLSTRVQVSGIDADEFAEIAQGAKDGCPVSQALTGIDTVELDAELV